jgi:hypothetical protein
MFPNDYDLPHDIWKLVFLHVNARDICAFRAIDKEASRVAPFVPHTQGPITHCMKPMNKGHADAFVWTIEQYDRTVRYTLRLFRLLENSGDEWTPGHTSHLI